MQSRDQLFELQRERERLRKYEVLPYIAFIGELSCDGLEQNSNEENQCNELQELEPNPSNKVSDIYIIINSFEFRVTSNSMVDAVQYCLKSIISLNNALPHECVHLWDFIFRHVCDLNAKGMKKNRC